MTNQKYPDTDFYKGMYRPINTLVIVDVQERLLE